MALVERNSEYHSWKSGDLQTAIEMLKRKSLKQTALHLEVSPNSLRHALKRRRISVRALRRMRIGDAPIPPVRIPEPGNPAIDPFVAMAVMEAKEPNGCSWPYGDLVEGDFYFCGKPRKSKSSYCPECAAKAHIS